MLPHRQDDLLRYSNCSLTYRIVERIFGQVSQYLISSASRGWGQAAGWEGKGRLLLVGWDAG